MTTASLRWAALGAALVAFTGLSTPASAAPAGADVPASAPAVPPTYTNPLRLTLPSGRQADNCADPYVIHGQTAGDTNWYLYCTTDELDPTQTTSSGDLVMHRLPTYRSTDLTHWTYVDDALAANPSWVAPSAGLWAPDVTYSDGLYHLYYTASDTSLPGGGSAVGVLTSSSPTGPWTDAGKPVVEPGGTPSNPTSKAWKFDPEVVTSGGHSYIYYGSFFGGVFVRELTADGMSTVPGTERQIAIDNRYEGTFIVKRDGWFYFMGSATNCCSGPLTGYTVFAARSRSPLGPFLDKDGRSILDSRVGGTPMLYQNGNKWVGTGHNAVVTDFSGQDWVYYHAVDQQDPYVAAHVGSTKRPLLADPLDWHDGWPIVRGGAGPSDQPMPGPVAQPGWRTTYHARYLPQPQPGRPDTALSDAFTGSQLSSQWSWVREPDAGTWSVGGGSLTMKTQNADIHPPSTPLASVLTERAPSGDYVAQVRVKVDTPTSGCCYNYVQGALMIYGDDGHYIKLDSVSIWNTRQTEFGKEDSSEPADYPSYGNSVVGPVGDWTWLRIVHHMVGGLDAYSAYTSLDGENWVGGVTWTADLGSAPRIGLASFGGSGFTTTFQQLSVSALAGSRPSS